MAPRVQWTAAAAAAAAALAAAALAAAAVRCPQGSARELGHSDSTPTAATSGAGEPGAVAPGAAALAVGAAAAVLFGGGGGAQRLPHVLDAATLSDSMLGPRSELRRAAQALHGADGTSGGSRELRCESNAETGAELCGWRGELLSPKLFNGYKHERHIWRLALAIFEEHVRAGDAGGPNGGALLLDVGANIGDWVTPLALSRTPGLHVAAVEALPANAALAAHNLGSALRERRRGSPAGKAVIVYRGHGSGPSPLPGKAYVLPYALLSTAGARRPA
eukprot:TRINITY_DN13366_c0_g2_i3.p1 TRINITY_DN13366_c0_g2~~TRINITY_DN13366_c0_g2_i3.p1  ORF type:complete len:297 (+),score=79.94 TRINITY_DN13366_c0_g2_i3:62-892(+)